MDWVWRELRQAWIILRQAPLLFCLTWFVGLIVIWALVDKVYRSRLEARDDLLRGYQEKLGLGPFKKGEYSKLENPDLRKKATQLADSIRTFTAVAKSQISTDPLKFWPYVASQYSNEFKIASILLRDEIIIRLPEGMRGVYQQSDPKGMIAFVYQNPVHTRGMEMVADDLVKLAKMLPD